MRPFFITALPRSGTTFLANFFTHGGVFCWHEATCGAPDMETFRARMSLRDYYMVGNSDSGLGRFHAQVRDAFPDAHWIGIDREPTQVAASLFNSFGWPGNEGFNEMVEQHREALKGCDLVIPFDHLFLTETLRDLWQNVTNLTHDERRAAMLVEMRVQPDLVRYSRRYVEALAQPTLEAR